MPFNKGPLSPKDKLRKASATLESWLISMSRLGILPIFYSKETNKFLFRNDQPFLILFSKFRAILLYMFSAFLVTQICRGFFMEDDGIIWRRSTRSRLFLRAFGTLTAAFGHLFGWKKYASFSLLMNRIFVVQDSMSEEAAATIPSKNYKRAIVVSNWLFYLVALSHLIEILRRKKVPDALSAFADMMAVDGRPNLDLGVRLVLFLFQFLMVQAVLLLPWNFILCGTYCNYIIQAAAQDLHVNLSEPITSNRVKFRSATATKLKLALDNLRIINSHYHDCLGLWNTTVFVLVHVTCIVATYFAINLNQYRIGILGLLAFRGYSYFIKSGSQAYDKSKNALRSWQAIADQPLWFRKYRKAAQPLQIKISGSFHFDRGYFLTFVDLVLRQTVAFTLLHQVE